MIPVESCGWGEVPWWRENEGAADGVAVPNGASGTSGAKAAAPEAGSPTATTGDGAAATAVDLRHAVRAVRVSKCRDLDVAIDDVGREGRA
jgi:hypothetical protein